MRDDPQAQAKAALIAAIFPMVSCNPGSGGGIHRGAEAGGVNKPGPSQGRVDRSTGSGATGAIANGNYDIATQRDCTTHVDLFISTRGKDNHELGERAA